MKAVTPEASRNGLPTLLAFSGRTRNVFLTKMNALLPAAELKGQSD
jgi:hypothetical protein